MSLERTRELMNRYFSSNHADVGALADDAVFTVMSTGQQYRGPKEILQMLNYFYHVAFDADAESSGNVIADGKAVFEGTFTGIHIGEFAGIPATKKKVRVPLCVAYDVDNDKITNARIYLEMPVLMKQLGEP
jgi:predicted ester cyclase